MFYQGSRNAFECMEATGPKHNFQSINWVFWYKKYNPAAGPKSEHSF